MTTTQAEDNIQVVLQSLHDIQLPEVVSYWPLAWGWWSVIFSVGLLCAYGLWLRLTERRRNFAKTLRELRARQAAGEDVRQSVSIFMRQVSLHYYSKIHVASLHGERWLALLDESMPNQAFSKGVGQRLATLPYEKNYSPLSEDIF